MIEDDLALSQCTGIDFVKHNETICRAFGDLCEDKKKQPSTQRTGARLLSFVIGGGFHVVDGLLNKKVLFNPLNTAYNAFPAPEKFDGPISGEKRCENIVRGALGLYGTDQLDQARELLSMISSKDSYVKAVKEVVRAHFGEPEWEPSDF